MQKLSSIAIQILGVTIGVIAAGALRTAMRTPAVRPNLSTVQPTAAVIPASSNSQTWDQYMAQEACSNLRKGMKLERAGFHAGTVVALDDRFSEQVRSMSTQEIKKQLGATLVDTCLQEIEAAAEREGL